MRKIVLCLILIALVPLVRAQFDINLERSYYSSGETLQAKINTNVNFVDGISLSKINLTDSENKRVQVALNLFNLGNGSYYLFFDLPSDLKEGNYSLNFGNLLYYDEGLLKRELFKKEFSIINDKGNVLSVYPVFVKLNLEYWERPSISIKLDNKLNETIIMIPNTTYLVPSKNALKLGKSSYTLLVALNNDAYKLNAIKDELSLNYGNYSYKIPFLIDIKQKNALVEIKENATEISTGAGELRFIESVDYVNKTLNKDTVINGSLRFKNFGNNVLHGINFTLTNDLDEIIKVSYNELNFLNPGDERAVNLVINEKGNINKNYKGELIVNSKEGANAKFNFNLNYFKKEETKEIPIANETNVSISPPIANKKSNMLRNIIITIIFILFILAGYFIYKKSKKPKMKVEDLFR